jgi:hypothetical protein
MIVARHDVCECKTTWSAVPDRMQILRKEVAGLPKSGSGLVNCSIAFHLASGCSPHITATFIKLIMRVYDNRSNRKDISGKRTMPMDAQDANCISQAKNTT